VTNITFSFETSPNTKPKNKKWGAWYIMSPLSEKVGGHGSCVPHQISTMHDCNHGANNIGCVALICQSQLSRGVGLSWWNL